MRSDAGMAATGYRQPAQARIFGQATVVMLALLAALLLGIRLTRPPTAAIDAGRTASFVVESIPLDRPKAQSRPTPVDAAPRTTPAPPSPAPLSPAPANEPAAPASLPAASPAPPAIVETEPATTGSTAADVPAAPAASDAADWRARLLGHLRRHRRYPRQAEATGQQGIARVAITLHRSGEVIAVHLVRGSGYPLLDMEARATPRRASPLPPPDDAIPGDPVTVEVPIDFAMRR